VETGKLVDIFDVFAAIAQWSGLSATVLMRREGTRTPTRTMIGGPGDRELYDPSVTVTLCSPARRTGMMIMTKTHYYVRENTVL
jgi:hypothetical protein